jgi:hypothetical protein
MNVPLILALLAIAAALVWVGSRMEGPMDGPSEGPF